MGFALAEVLANCGSMVVLVSGPVAIKPVHKTIEYIPVHTAHEMLEACLRVFPGCDGAVLSAAVADYRPKSPVKNKMKRKGQNLLIELEPNPDIAATLGKMKRKDQFMAGFALETDDELNNAKAKLLRKNLDLIVLNSLNDKGSGFISDTNKITILDKNNKITHFELKPKYDVAVDIINYLENLAGT